jgi:alkanesulfonate monooxygenase SsuD/methylene tetrahydromethanopterin reductase-like flavin-dependent oxidoreductase (luciferase family)
MPLRISVSLRTGHPGAEARAGARWVIERAAAAAEVGLDGLYVGDQHVAGIPYYQNTAILGRALAEWDDRPCGALYLLPLWHPVIVAEQVGTLAAIAEGPFVLQCAIGGGPHQFAGLGVDMRRRVRDFEASLDVIRRLLLGEQVTAEQPVPVQGAQVSPRPPDGFQVWIGADVDNGIGRAARLGDAWYAGPSLTLADATTKLDRYRSRLAAEGRTTATFPIRRDVYVAESEADAEVVRTRIAEQGHRGFDPSVLVIGTPEDVAARFAAFGDLGFTEIVTRQLHDDPAAALASTRRLGRVREILAG